MTCSSWSPLNPRTYSTDAFEMKGSWKAEDKYLKNTIIGDPSVESLLGFGALSKEIGTKMRKREWNYKKKIESDGKIPTIYKKKYKLKG